MQIVAKLIVILHNKPVICSTNLEGLELGAQEQHEVKLHQTGLNRVACFVMYIKLNTSKKIHS